MTPKTKRMTETAKSVAQTSRLKLKATTTKPQECHTNNNNKIEKKWPKNK